MLPTFKLRNKNYSLSVSKFLGMTSNLKTKQTPPRIFLKGSLPDLCLKLSLRLEWSVSWTKYWHVLMCLELKHNQMSGPFEILLHWKENIKVNRNLHTPFKITDVIVFSTWCATTVLIIFTTATFTDFVS